MVLFLKQLCQGKEIHAVKNESVSHRATSMGPTTKASGRGLVMIALPPSHVSGRRARWRWHLALHSSWPARPCASMAEGSPSHQATHGVAGLEEKLSPPQSSPAHAKFLSAAPQSPKMREEEGLERAKSWEERPEAEPESYEPSGDSPCWQATSRSRGRNRGEPSPAGKARAGDSFPSRGSTGNRWAAASKATSPRATGGASNCGQLWPSQWDGDAHACWWAPSRTTGEERWEVRGNQAVWGETCCLSSQPATLTTLPCSCSPPLSSSPAISNQATRAHVEAPPLEGNSSAKR